MLVCLTEFVYLASHEVYDAKSKLLCLGRLSMMLADKGYKAFCKPDETDTEGSMVDYRLNVFMLANLLAVKPERSHKERELLLQSGLLELESLIKLFCSYLKDVVKLLEELMKSVFLILYVHALKGKLHDIDGSE